MTTAMQRIAHMGGALPDFVHDALRLARHPEERTMAFHRFYGAPIAAGPMNATFSHMDDQRVAFRAAFILSEAIELLEKGLGLEVHVAVYAKGKRPAEPVSMLDDMVEGSANGPLTTVIQNAMAAAPGQRNGIEVIDALGDLNVVVNGFAVELGVDMRIVDAEVCASNFTKADENGQPLISDGTDGHPKGKVLKGPNFLEPQIAELLGMVDPS